MTVPPIAQPDTHGGGAALALPRRCEYPEGAAGDAPDRLRAIR